MLSEFPHISCSVAQYFEQLVQKQPDHIALKIRDRTLTYQELNQRANQFARWILQHQGDQDIPSIALFFGQGIDFVIAILGVLKLGKTYIPIDPALPIERNRYIVQNSQASLVVTPQTWYATAQALCDRTITLLNYDECDRTRSDTNLDRDISPDAPAYIIYTSGSTGQPKGVLQNNRNLLHNALTQIQYLQIGEGDRMPVLHSCSVMGAVRALFNGLLSGATLYPFDVKRHGLVKLRELLQTEQITIIHGVSTLLRHFSHTLTPADQFPALRLVIFGGEGATRKDLEWCQRQFSSRCAVVSGLGTTETGTVCLNVLGHKARVTTAALPIGTPVHGMEVKLLNPQGEEVQPGEVGEIVVRSQYLALGYFQNPERTQAVFIPDPTDPQYCLYYTGDLGQWSPDGTLTHQGRKDFQVKVRGFRVELGDIETSLLDHDNVKEAIATGQLNANDEMTLAAYIVPKHAPAPSVPELKQFLATKIPSYMIPEHIMELVAFPLTANGKVNRKALIAQNPVSAAAPEPEEFRVPIEPLRQTLTKIMQAVLNRHRVGLEDDFFELGGNSLLAIEFLARIETTLGKTLPLATFLAAPTIEQLAQTLQNSDWIAPWHSLVPIQKTGTKPPLFCVHGGGFNILVYRTLAVNLGTDQPVYGLQAQGLDGKTTPHSEIEQMAVDYIHHIRTLQPEGPYYIAGLSYGGTIALEMAQQLTAAQQQVALLALFDSSTPEARRKLAPTPRFFSSVGYVCRYSLPRWLQKQLRRRGQTSPAPTLPQPEATEATASSPSSSRRSTAVSSSKRERFSHWVLTRSPWSFLTKKSEAEGLRGQAADAVQHLEQFHQIAQEKYQLRPYPGKITVFMATERPPGFWEAADLGWGAIAQQGVTCYPVPGDHTSIMRSPHLANQLRHCLEQARTQTEW